MGHDEISNKRCSSKNSARPAVEILKLPLSHYQQTMLYDNHNKNKVANYKLRYGKMRTILPNMFFLSSDCNYVQLNIKFRHYWFIFYLLTSVSASGNFPMSKWSKYVQVIWKINVFIKIRLFTKQNTRMLYFYFTMINEKLNLIAYVNKIIQYSIFKSTHNYNKYGNK